MPKAKERDGVTWTQDARMIQRYAHLSLDYMAGTVGKLGGVFAGVMPVNPSGEAALVLVESPRS